MTRASGDYLPGDNTVQWAVGATSILAWSLSVFPYKDTFYTNASQLPNPQEGCQVSRLGLTRKLGLTCCVDTFSTWIPSTIIYPLDPIPQVPRVQGKVSADPRDRRYVIGRTSGVLGRPGQHQQNDGDGDL
jgi:hypothetical protein